MLLWKVGGARSQQERKEHLRFWRDGHTSRLMSNLAVEIALENRGEQAAVRALAGNGRRKVTHPGKNRRVGEKGSTTLFWSMISVK